MIFVRVPFHLYLVPGLPYYFTMGFAPHDANKKDTQKVSFLLVRMKGLEPIQYCYH